MAASLGEANAMARACRLNGVVFNMGAQRRFHPGFWKMREIIGGGELGALQNLVMTYASGLFDHGCHTIDLAQYLNGDAPALWVQGSNQRSVPPREGDVYREDPGGSGVVFFANGVTLYLLNTNGYEYQAHCEGGMMGTYNDTGAWVMRSGNARDRQPRQFPSWPRQSPTSNLILDLVRALDTGDPPLGGVETARHGVEIAVAILESHLHGGKRIELPLEDSSVRLHRVSRDAWQRRHRWREPKLAE
jgi:predicted dehydrogenase